MRHLRTLFAAFTFSLLLCFLACTGGAKGGRPGGDADGSLGLKPRDFFRVESPSKITIVRLFNPTRAHKYFSEGTASLIDLGDIPIEKIKLSLDEAYLTIFGEAGVYEYQTVAADSLGTPGNNVQPTSLDALCITSGSAKAQFGNASFQELHINSKVSGYQLTALSSGTTEILGGESAIATRRFTASSLDYTLSGFGVLSILFNSPTPEDPNYFNTSVVNLRCRLNNLPASHTIFITSGVAGSLGGLAGADLLCDTQAKNGSKTKLPGEWRAILSDATTNVKDRILFYPGAVIVNTQGETIVPIGSSLWAGTIANPIKYDQDASLGPSEAWTGSLADGTKAPGLDTDTMCSSWTSGSNAFYGVAGNAYVADSTWMSTGIFMNEHCGVQGGHLNVGVYCINSAQ